MDDYTWEKTIQRRRIRRRRQALLILVLLILALGAFFGWHSYAEKRTPEYALEQAAIAVQKKDADSFRHYVNLDLVTSRGYDDLTADLLSYDTTLTRPPTRSSTSRSSRSSRAARRTRSCGA